jgi:hypothetical protein
MQWNAYHDSDAVAPIALFTKVGATLPTARLVRNFLSSLTAQTDNVRVFVVFDRFPLVNSD